MDPRRWMKVALPAALAMSVTTATMGCSSDSTTTPPTTVSASSSNKGTGGSAGATTTTRASSTKDTLANQEIAGYRFEVLSAEVLDDSKALLPPSDGNVIVGINLAMTNITSEDQPLSTFAQLELKLTDGTSAQEVPPDASVEAFKDGNLPAGETMTGLVLYEVPKAALSSMSFEMAGDLSDARVRVELSLSAG